MYAAKECFNLNMLIIDKYGGSLGRDEEVLLDTLRYFLLNDENFTDQ